MTAAPAAPSGASDLAIDIRTIEKVYRGRVRALREASLSVRRGEIFGLLGPNGAGKSTLVKILLTIVKPTTIDGVMLGARIGDRPTLARIGYLPENPNFPDHLRGEEVLHVFGAMAKVPRRERKRRAEELLDLVGMRDWRRKRMRQYSKGMKQRIGLAQALMNDPDLVFLDEPTDGVDPVGRREIREMLVQIRNRGKTVLLNSHLLGEAEMVCDRVAILVQGEVRASGDLDSLAIGLARYEIELGLPDSVHAADALAFAAPGARFGDETVRSVTGELARVGSLASGARVEAERRVLRIGETDPEAVQPVLDALRAKGYIVRSLRPVRPSLEDLFMQTVSDPETGKSGVGAARNTRRKG